MTLGELLSFYAVVALMLRQLSVVLVGVPVVVAGLAAFERVGGRPRRERARPLRGATADRLAR